MQTCRTGKQTCEYTTGSMYSAPLVAVGSSSSSAMGNGAQPAHQMGRRLPRHPFRATHARFSPTCLAAPAHATASSRLAAS